MSEQATQTAAQETVRVHLDDDYYQGEFFREKADGEWELPREQVDRWRAAEEAYSKMQEEISALLIEERRRK